jgi:hypothetical protein
MLEQGASSIAEQHSKLGDTIGAERPGSFDPFHHSAEVVGRGTHRGSRDRYLGAGLPAGAVGYVHKPSDGARQFEACRWLHDPLGVKGEQHVVLRGLTLDETLIQPVRYESGLHPPPYRRRRGP